MKVQVELVLLVKGFHKVIREVVEYKSIGGAMLFVLAKHKEGSLVRVSGEEI